MKLLMSVTSTILFLLSIWRLDLHSEMYSLCVFVALVLLGTASDSSLLI